MAGKAGKSGRPKGSRPISIEVLREQLDKIHGKPFELTIAEMDFKLTNDFNNDTNIKEAVAFKGHLMKYLVEQPVQEVSVSNPLEELSSEDIKQRIDNLLTRAALAQPTISNTEPDDGEETQSD
jgi:uncharacterized protein YbcC (UPF0753/DUF2309 family)